MKNLEKLGKVLNKVEQKNVFGGDTITKYDPYCDQPEGQVPTGCPCSTNSQCTDGPFMGPSGPEWGLGVCVNGTCGLS